MEREFHDHCRSCSDRNCDFYIVQDVSCETVPCHNDCGQKFHKCKQTDHEQICLNALTTCLNKQYGCPVQLPRRSLARHLERCPANVVICMMEWNRLHRGSLLAEEDHTVPTKPMQGKSIISKNMDIALAIHDQRILLETIMPKEILQYYSDLADGKLGGENQKCGLIQDKPRSFVKVPDDKRQVNQETAENDSGKVKNKFMEDVGHFPRENNIDSELKERTVLCNSGDARTEESCSSNTKEKSSRTNPVNGHRSVSNELLHYVNKIRHLRNRDKSEKMSSHPSGSAHNDSAEYASSDLPVDLESPSTSAAKNASVVPYEGMFTHARDGSDEESGSDARVCKSEAPSEFDSRCMVKDFQHLDEYIKNFSAVSPEFLSLLDLLDSDVCSAIDIVDFLVEEVTRKIDGQNDELPLLSWDDTDVMSPGLEREKAGYELCRSIDEMIQGLGAVCDLTLESITPPNPPTETAAERKRNRREERKKRSWLYSSGFTGGPLTSWGWNPRKETKEAATDTDDLIVDQSNFEWLSPEANISQCDFVSRLFSIIGAKYRGRSPHIHKQMTPYLVDSWCQTVAPFLVNIDMNAIGRALCSSSLTSSEQNAEERRRILSLMSTEHPENSNRDPGEVKMSDNLAYDNLVLDSVMESLPRYQCKPPAMFSFMCGCELRRDQFAAHVANIHCEIMAGLNGWLEAKCPYALYGCEYTQPRFCPGRQGDKIAYNQVRNCFTIRPTYDVRSDPLPFICFNDLPYEIHERVFEFLDCVSLDQLSRTCRRMREMCEAHLVTRGVVRMHWTKKTYEDGSQSWKLGSKTWSFPPHFTEIDRWVLSDCPSMAQHVSRCEVASKVSPSYQERAKFSLIGPTPEMAELRRRRSSI